MLQQSFLFLEVGPPHIDCASLVGRFNNGLNVVKGLIFPLLHFSALIILFKENISLRCKRSCLRLVKKLTGEFMRVNELYFLIEYKILEGFVY